MATDPIVKEVYIEAAPEKVFEFLTDPAKMVRWMGLEAELEPKPGGKYRLDPNGRDVIQGTYLEVVENSKIVFTWGWDQPGHRVPAGSTTVEIHLEARGSGTWLRLTHRELPHEARDTHEMGWGHYLSRLKITAEGGDAGRDPFADPSVRHG